MTILRRLTFPFFAFFILVACNAARTTPIKALSGIPAGATTGFIFTTARSNAVRTPITFHETRKFTSGDSSQSAETSIYQPVATGIYIAQENDRRPSHAEDEKVESGDLMTFILSGRTEKEVMGELKGHLEKHNKAVVLDLKGVKLVDRDAVRFLASFETGRAKITNCPRYIREWIRRERKQQ